MPAVIGGLIFTFLGSQAFAQAVENAPTLPVTAASVPMLWHADVVSSAAVISLTEGDRAVRWLLPAAKRGSGSTPRLIRVVELVTFDFPVAVFFVSLNHDLGHEFRAGEARIPTSLHLTGSPWSLHPFFLDTDLAVYPRVRTGPLFDLGFESSGLEASWLLKDRLDERVSRHGDVRFGEASMLLVAAMDTPFYAAARLGPNALRDLEFGSQGDVAAYVYELRTERMRAGQLESDIRSRIRGRCFLNLIDFSLWNDVAAVGTWLMHGDESRRLSWLTVGGVGLIPSMRYSLTPIGPEFSIRSQFRKGRARGSAYVRWSESIGKAKQTGAGVTYFVPPVHGFEPTIRFDVWSHTLNGNGIRGEMSLAALNWPNPRARVSATIGAKSSGYLEGYPVAHSTYGAVALNLAVR